VTVADEKYAGSLVEAIEAHRKFARDAIEQAAERGSDRIKRGRYVEHEARDLMIHIDNARTALDVLGQHLDGLTRISPEAGLQAWYYVGPLREAMYQIGGLVEVSVSGDLRAKEFDNRVRKPHHARTEKQKKTKARQDALDAAILACVDGEHARLSSSWDKMCPCREDVLPRLSEEHRRIASVSTIRGRIMFLRKSGSAL
jgi:hypothetical protein